MANTVADLLWEMLQAAGVSRCYGNVEDALNPVIAALHRHAKIEFIHVRHEEYGVFAAVAEASLTGNPVAVCGTAGPGAAHLINGLMDARKEGAPVIAIAGETPSDSRHGSEARETPSPWPGGPSPHRARGFAEGKGIAPRAGVRCARLWQRARRHVRNESS
jgi:thiamine pyrophosphate-dependent acetolactate synthase large subunit-like protein